VFSTGPVLVDGAGSVDVPDKRGLGIDVDWAAASDQSYERDHLPSPLNPTESVQDW